MIGPLGGTSSSAARLASDELPLDRRELSLLPWLNVGFAGLILAGIIAIHLKGATIAGNELSWDRSIFTVFNAATLTGFQQTISFAQYSARGQWTVLILMLGGTMYALIAGGILLSRTLRLGYAQLAAVNRLLVEGLTGLSSRQVVGRVGPPATGGFALGVEVTATFDEKNYVGIGVFLVASVLERFLGQYASINSFTQLVAKTMHGAGVLKKWPPRVGALPLL